MQCLHRLVWVEAWQWEWPSETLVFWNHLSLQTSRSFTQSFKIFTFTNLHKASSIPWSISVYLRCFEKIHTMCKHTTVYRLLILKGADVYWTLWRKYEHLKAINLSYLYEYLELLSATRLAERFFLFRSRNMITQHSSNDSDFRGWIKPRHARFIELNPKDMP